MKRLIGMLLVLLILCPAAIGLAASDPDDIEGSKDPPMFNRMPGYFIYSYKDVDFDQLEFRIGPNKTTVVEGRRLYVLYNAKNGLGKIPSGLQIVRNYTDAVKAIGGQLVYSYEDSGSIVTLKVVKNSVETWVCVSAAPNGINYEVNILEKQPMKQDIVAKADSMAQSIKNTGRVALYGIYFDTGKATIKPESDPALKEIAKLLKGDPKLKLYVVGHTDNVGGFEYNMKLSKDRADAVMKALTGQYGVAASRLLAYGVGPLCPAASNATEEGRAQNRRVELVGQ